MNAILRIGKWIQLFQKAKLVTRCLEVCTSFFSLCVEQGIVFTGFVLEICFDSSDDFCRCLEYQFFSYLFVYCDVVEVWIIELDEVSSDSLEGDVSGVVDWSVGCSQIHSFDSFFFIRIVCSSKSIDSCTYFWDLLMYSGC